MRRALRSYCTGWSARMAGTMLAVASFTAAQAQTIPEAPASHAEVAVSFEHLNSNTLPAGCGCFGENGGSVEFAWRPEKSHFAGVGEAAIVHTGNITASQYTLTLSTFTVGGRYLPRLGTPRFQPYAQVLVGFAHSGGTLVQGYGNAAGTGGSAFAGEMGGGLDVKLTEHFALRAIEVDYLATTFSNGTNNHQNNLRLDSGLVFHF